MSLIKNKAPYFAGLLLYNAFYDTFNTFALFMNTISDLLPN